MLNSKFGINLKLLPHFLKRDSITFNKDIGKEKLNSSPIKINKCQKRYSGNLK